MHPALSVVLPTHGRRESLLRVLQGLTRQSVPRGTFDVVVVCDGDVDGSAAACHALSSTLPFMLHVVEQDNSGPAAARNRGVAEATSPLILFLDDDVVPEDSLVAAHLAAHADTDRRVVVGPLLPPPDVRLNLWGAWEEKMLCSQYDDQIRGRWQTTYRQFHTGNASLLRRHILDAGGFDARFLRAEDVELALRLRDRGLQFVFAPEARTLHYVRRTYDAWLRIPAAYGAAAVAMARDGHPETVQILAREYRQRHGAIRALVQLSVGRPILYRLAASLLGIMVRSVDRTNAIPYGDALCSLVYNLVFFEGLAGALGGRGAFLDLLRQESAVRLHPPAEPWPGKVGRQEP